MRFALFAKADAFILFAEQFFSVLGGKVYEVIGRGGLESSKSEKGLKGVKSKRQGFRAFARKVDAGYAAALILETTNIAARRAGVLFWIINNCTGHEWRFLKRFNKKDLPLPIKDLLTTFIGKEAKPCLTNLSARL